MSADEFFNLENPKLKTTLYNEHRDLHLTVQQPFYGGNSYNSIICIILYLIQN